MMIRSFTKKLTLAGLAVGACLSSTDASAAQVQKTAIKAGTVITGTGEPLQNGVIVIEGGRVTAVGPEATVEIPWDANVIEMPDMTAFPGFVETHVSAGMDRANEGMDIAPYLSVEDAIDPVNVDFEQAIRSGTLAINVSQGVNTVIAGQSAVVKPFGPTVQSMIIRPGTGITMSMAPRRGKTTATQVQALRGAFEDLRRYLEGMAQRQKAGDDFDRREALAQGREIKGEDAKGRPLNCKAWTVEGFERVPRGEVDEEHAPLLAVVEGRLQAFIYCASPRDVHTALKIAEANGFTGNTTLYLAAPCWKAADSIKKAGVSVLLAGNLTHVDRHPLTGEVNDVFVPKVYHDAGIKFALASGPNGLWFQAAQCVAGGIPRAKAIAAVTEVPAEILKLDGRVGCIKKGSDGNVALFSGDPLSVTSVVEHVIIDGKHVYDRSKDPRTRQLQTGEARPGTSAPAAEDDTDGADDEAGENPAQDEGSEDDETNKDG